MKRLLSILLLALSAVGSRGAGVAYDTSTSLVYTEGLGYPAAWVTVSSGFTNEVLTPSKLIATDANKGQVSVADMDALELLLGIGLIDADEFTAALAAKADSSALAAENALGPNAGDGLVDWTQLVNVPVGLADGTDDGGTSAPEGTLINTTTPTTGALLRFSSTSTTNIEPSNITSDGDSLIIPAKLTAKQHAMAVESHSGTPVVIDASYKEHDWTLTEAGTFSLSNIGTALTNTETLFITIDASTALNVTNTTDTFVSIGRWGNLVEGLNTLSINRRPDGTLTISQDTGLIDTDQVSGLDTALAEKAPLISPDLAGTPTAPTPAQGDNSTKLATTAYVDEAVAAIEVIGGGVDFETFVATDGNTETYLWTNAVAEGQSIFVSAQLLGGGPTNQAAFHLDGLFSYPTGGSLTKIGTNDVSAVTTGAITAGLKADGSNLHISVAGADGEAMNWGTKGFYTVVTNGEPDVTVSYLLEQGFEGSGTEGVWTTSGVGYDFDYTTGPLEGTESLRIAASAQQPRVTADFAASGEVGVFMRIKPVSIPATDAVISRVMNSASGQRMVLTLKPTGALQILPQGGTAQETVGTMTAGTVYYVWAHYRKSTGANDGYADIAFSTDEATKPTSGDNFKASSDGTETDDVSKLNIGLASVNTVEYIVDKVRVDDEEIGASPL